MASLGLGDENDRNVPNKIYADILITYTLRCPQADYILLF